MTDGAKNVDYEDEAFNDLERSLQRKVATGVTDGTSGKRYSSVFPFEEINADFDAEYAKHKRNEVLEEVAKRFDAMVALGDTAASFAAYVRGMKT